MAPSIAIVGAGPAGLTLARLLQVTGIPLSVTIFEMDAGPKSRKYQGGTLDLHTDTGLAALKEAGLWDEFTKHARYEGQEMIIADKNGTVLMHKTEPAETAGSEERPEIDREKLKGLLLESIDAGCIRWGKHLRSVKADEGLLVFDDGSTDGPFDLVIGADGAWSKVRSVLTDIEPHYSGVCGFDCNIPNADEEHPKLSKMVGLGSYHAFSDCKAMMAQRLGDGSIKAAVWLLKEKDYPAKLLAECGTDESKLKDKIVEQYTDWLPELHERIRVGTRFRPWPLYELPVGHSWEHKKGFTMIGDAAHLMTPFGGEGVNAAMKDALEFSQIIVAYQKYGGDLDAAVKAFEEKMFPRVKVVQAETMRNKIYAFRDDTPFGFLNMMRDLLKKADGEDH